MLPFTHPTPGEADRAQFFVPLNGHHFSALEFYDQVEADLRARRLPRLRRRRVAFHEGSRLSDRRLYLRLARERFSFELCAAPFGTGYFFSLRYVEVPRGGWIALIFLLLLVGAVVFGGFLLANYLLYHATGWVWLALGLADVAAIVGLLFHHARQDAENPPDPLDQDDPVQEMPDFDSIMLGLPVIGEWYERVRKETYYRCDTRLMYRTIVSEIVHRRVNELVATNGVQLMRPPFDHDVMQDFFQRDKLS